MGTFEREKWEIENGRGDGEKRLSMKERKMKRHTGTDCEKDLIRWTGDEQLMSEGWTKERMNEWIAREKKNVTSIHSTI